MPGLAARGCGSGRRRGAPRDSGHGQGEQGSEGAGESGVGGEGESRPRWGQGRVVGGQAERGCCGGDRGRGQRARWAARGIREGTSEAAAGQRLTGSRKGWERGRKQKERRRSGGAGNLLSVFSMSGVRVISGHSLTL